MDPCFRSANLRHNVVKLLRLGWLLCLFRSEQEQLNELWNLINSDLESSVSKADVMAFVDTLTTFAVKICKSK